MADRSSAVPVPNTGRSEGEATIGAPFVDAASGVEVVVVVVEVDLDIDAQPRNAAERIPARVLRSEIRIEYGVPL